MKAVNMCISHIVHCAWVTMIGLFFFTFIRKLFSFHLSSSKAKKNWKEFKWYVSNLLFLFSFISHCGWWSRRCWVKNERKIMTLPIALTITCRVTKWQQQYFFIIIKYFHFFFFSSLFAPIAINNSIETHL